MVQARNIVIKSPREIELMRKAGRAVARVLARLAQEATPGMATADLEKAAIDELAKQGVKSSFKGYRGFPGYICVSVNEEVVHGIPGERTLGEGDIVSIDVGATYQGFQGDGAITVGVGKLAPERERLIAVTREALEAGIAAARAGAHLGDVSAAIQSYVENRGFSVVREYVGHGIGREMHEEPQVPNFGDAGKGPVLRPGMTLALEPMVNAGDWRTKVLPNHWTVVTADGSLSAHFEHTILITEGGAEILTVC